MNSQKEDFPLLIKIGFSKLFEHYKSMRPTATAIVADRIDQILAIADTHPVLTEGIDSYDDLEKYRDQIDIVLEDLFSSVLTQNEIKVACTPYREVIFKTSQRYKNIMSDAGSDYRLSLSSFDEDQAYIMGCSIILAFHYGYKIDFRRPIYYNIPDADGMLRFYRGLYNADFVEIEKTATAKEITPDDYNELLDNFDNIAMWKEKFPPNSWLFKGFVIANMYDATSDVSISNFKAALLKEEATNESFVDEFLTIIRSLFKSPDLQVGFTLLNQDENVFEQVAIPNSVSYILNGKEYESCKTALCKNSFETLFDKQKLYSVSDVEHYSKLYPENPLYKTLHQQHIKSAIITSIVCDGEVLGLLEIVSPSTYELNSINANKLEDIMPYLVDSVKRTKEKTANEIELLIQNECTSIHPSVHWRFEKEARRVIQAHNGNIQTSFKEITFTEVYPLYGQIDIKGSSEARNNTIKEDGILQLQEVKKIIQLAYKLEALPIYEQLEYNINNYLEDFKLQLQVDSERHLLDFFQAEIKPLFKHLRKKNDKLKSQIDTYFNSVDETKGFVYKHRKDYDESVMHINKSMAAILDQKQKEAQRMYPHYFERFKTDGVEHNLYIGESITKKKSFNKIYLYNLRLWQMQVMCEMENSYYRLKTELAMPLNVASMILVFNSPLALRFRMDEKRFDVDGTYNARYEVVKKRVDKAKIKGTDIRITQPGKISIIFSQKEDEIEYLKYIGFLQSKKQLGTEVEIVELEDLQSVTGLKAILVNILYHKDERDKEYYTYADLMQEIDD